jgi:hypothetical protein
VRETTAVLVPKAAMHEDHFTLSWENQVRLSRQVGAVKSVAVAHEVNKPPHRQFGRSIFRPDRSHHLASVHNQQRPLSEFFFKPIECSLVFLGAGFLMWQHGVALNGQYAPTNELGNRRSYCVANEPSSSTVQPAGNPISFSHSVQVKFLAT